MKIKTSLTSIWITQAIALVLFLAVVFKCTAQSYGYVWDKKDKPHYLYLNAAFDVNQALHLKDNPRMKVQTWGFQWQLEGGIRVDYITIYGFYGRFDVAEYQIYGAGMDYNIDWFYQNDIDLTIGLAYSIPQFRVGNAWHDVGGIAIRTQAQWFFLNDLAVGLRGIFQQRNDVIKGYIFEGQMYITYKFNQGW